jgi:hypothetical protein
MEVTNDQNYDVVFTFVKHPYFGMLVEANAVLMLPSGEYSLTYQRIREKNAAYYRLNAEQTEAVTIIEEFEAEAVMKRFYKATKRIRPAEFFIKHYDEQMHKLVRAFIEKRMLKVLELIRNYPLFISGKAGEATDKPLKYSEEPASLLFHFRRDETGTNYFITIRQGAEKVEFYHNDSEVLTTQPSWLLTPAGLYHFARHIDGTKIKPFLLKKHIHVDPKNEDVYMEKFVKPLLENHDVFAKGVQIVTEQFQASPVLKLLPDFGGKVYIALYFHYGNWNFPFHVNKRVNVSVEKIEDGYLFHRIRRSYNWEAEKVGFLNELGLENIEGSLFALEGTEENFRLIEWVNNNYDVLERAGFEIIQEQASVAYFLGPTKLDVQVNKENDWFDVKAIVRFGDFQIPFIRLRKYILEKRREFILPDGSIAILPDEWFTRFGKIVHFAEVEGDSLRLKNIHFSLLDDLEDIISEEVEQDFGWSAQLRSNAIPEYELPSGVQASLRNYQQTGYNWIRFLMENKVGPLLADDMGLGKTIQTLAVLRHLADTRKAAVAKKGAVKARTEVLEMDHQSGTPQISLFGGEAAAELPTTGAKAAAVNVKIGPSLVIAPKSLLYNWKSEAAKFTPGLKVLIYSGVTRSRQLRDFEKSDVVVMSYGTMRNDAEVLSQFHFNCMVLDESQAIKNPSSLTARNLHKLVSDYRLALTGTPIENSLLDIWSQMHFLNPGLLGSYGFFEKQYIKPIEKSADQGKSQELRKILDPFILRRTKKQVASELPEKIEKVHFCEMTEAQTELYEKTKSQYRNEILDHVQQVGMARSRQKIFNGLIHLRQLALNPQLKDDDYAGGSGKDDEIRHMLKKALEAGHKILVFSQFVSYLRIFQDMLESEGIPFCYLDGSMESKQRSEEIDKFQNDATMRVFLLSLRAGNSGINLTAADYVFLADPWWNPFTMRQAEDRAHRIGQEKTVFSYSFITRNTIEEKILRLQKKKTELAESIIPDEENILAGLNVEELEDLLN